MSFRSSLLRVAPRMLTLRAGFTCSHLCSRVGTVRPNSVLIQSMRLPTRFGGHGPDPGTKIGEPGPKDEHADSNPFYGDPFMPREEVAKRVIAVVKNFDKVTNPDKVTENSHFVKDLGLDSLDVVELVIQLEDEFVLDIPDDDAEQLQSVADVIEYVSHHPMSR